jgi:hypothetical protein
MHYADEGHITTKEARRAGKMAERKRKGKAGSLGFSVPQAISLSLS